MSWISGVDLLDNVWVDIEEYIPKNKRDEVAMKLVNHFEDEGADNCQESDFSVLRKAAKLIAGDEDEDDE